MEEENTYAEEEFIIDNENLGENHTSLEEEISPEKNISLDEKQSRDENIEESTIDSELDESIEKNMLKYSQNIKLSQSVKSNNGNTIGYINEFNNNNYTDESQGIKDPTTVWKYFSNKTKYRIDEKEIDRYANNLIKNRLIVLQCEDKRVIQNTIEDIVDHIIDKKKIKISQKRLFSIQPKDKDVDDDKPFGENQESITLSTFFQENFAKNKVSFIKIKLIPSEFFKSLFIEEKESFESIKTELISKNIFFICYVQEKALLNTIQSKRQVTYSKDQQSIERKFFFPLHKIPFLPVILQFHFKERWTEIQDILIGQKEQGFWGKNKTDNELYNGIYGYLEEGTYKLEQEIEKRRKGDFREKLVGKIETLPLDQKVHKHILFITAFFPQISISEFKLLVNLLLDGKTEETKIHKNLKGSENDEESKYEPKIIQLTEQWEKQGDEILSYCRIISSSLENGRVYFDFEEPELRDEVLTILQKRHFLFFEDQFQRIINSGIFFETKVSKQFVRNLTENLTNMVPYDPYLYGLNLLHWIFVRIFTQNKIQLKKRLEELSEEELNLMNNYINQQKFEREIGFNRLLDLMRLMLDKSELLSQQVLTFIEFLFQKNLFLVVLRIVEDLQNSSSINAIEWIKRILNQKEAKGEIHYECIRSLYRMAKLSTYETFDVLEKIKRWWSGKNPNGNLSLSQANSILLILFFGNPLFGRFPLSYYGKWPSKYFLFNFNENNVKDTWSFLIQWLFHPNMEQAYKIADNQKRKPDVSIEEILTKVRAFIIESWFLILNGLDKNIKLKPLQKKAITELYNTFINDVPLIQQKRLKRQWALMVREYMHEATKFKRKNNTQLTMLFIAKKEACRTLYNKFNKL
jgi:hypothetical protein